jgi:hypothetical protein
MPSGTKRVSHPASQKQLSGGDGGIRTLDTLLGYAHLANECLQPLGHVSGAPLLHEAFKDCKAVCGWFCGRAGGVRTAHGAI